MTRFSTLISLLLCFFHLWCSPLLPQEPGGVSRYRVTIAMGGKGEISGVCVIKTDTTGVTRGVIVNEFGLQGLAFTASPRIKKVKIREAMPALNKWYIKRVLAEDIKAVLTAGGDNTRSGKRLITLDDNGTVTLINEKYNIEYVFAPLPPGESDTESGTLDEENQPTDNNATD